MQHPRLARAARLWRACDRCQRPTKEPRRGLCGRCYQDDYHGRAPLERGCASCGQRDVRVLCRRTVGESLEVLCANCAAVLGRRPLTLEQLRAEVLAPLAGDQQPAARVTDWAALIRRRDRPAYVLELVFDREEVARQAG